MSGIKPGTGAQGHTATAYTGTTQGGDVAIPRRASAAGPWVVP
jgi:hypothetical protein